MDIVLDKKRCTKCRMTKPVAEFYERSGLPGVYQSQCKDCYKARSKSQTKWTRKSNMNISSVRGENMVIEELKRNGIYAEAGKTNAHLYVDVVAWGCIHIEVKYGVGGDGDWRFTLTPKQQQRGFLADFVVLVIEDEGGAHFYLLDPDDDVFFTSATGERKRKSALTYVAGRTQQKKHSESYAALTESKLMEAENQWHRINELRDRRAASGFQE